MTSIFEIEVEIDFEIKQDIAKAWNPDWTWQGASSAIIYKLSEMLPMLFEIDKTCSCLRPAYEY